MKKAVVLFLLFLFLQNNVTAQFNNNFWCFGDSAGINWTNPQTPSFFTSSVKGRGSCVTLSDSTGLLLYGQTDYSNHIYDFCRLFNKYDQFVQNTDSIVGEGWYHELLLLQLPESDSIAYLFSIGVTIPQDFGLYYSIVDYKANNDSGIVLVKNVQLLNFAAFDGLTAVKHGNGRDWWIVFQKYDNVGSIPNSSYYFFLLSDQGILSLPVQNLGPGKTSGGGQTLFNNEGNKFVVVNWGGLITLFDFDRCTGIISNPNVIEYERPASPYPYYFSAAFSSDDSKLFVVSEEHINPGNKDTLFQFNLNASNISASKQAIYYLPDIYRIMLQLKLAPDNKIYLASGDRTMGIPYPDTFYTQYNTHLSVINQPDSLGLACDFQPFSFYLGGNRTYYGLPNNPDYELGPLVGSACDTLTAIKDIKTEHPFFQAWFKGDWNTLFVNATKLKGKNALVRIFDSTGRLLLKQKGAVYSGYFTADVVLDNLVRGIYIVQLVTEKEKLSTKFIY